MKKKEKPRILYQKYKQEHGEHGYCEDTVERTKVSPIRKLGNVLTVFILLILILLAAVGTITLVDTSMREIFIQLIEMNFINA